MLFSGFLQVHIPIRYLPEKFYLKFCLYVCVCIGRAGNGTSESFDETGSADGDSIASESSSETSKSHDDSDNTTVPSCPVDLTAPWVDISVLEVDNPNLFMVSHNGGF